MNDLGIPILKKAYDLYHTFHEYRKVVPKNDRFTVFERCEDTILDLLECFVAAGFGDKDHKIAILERASIKLNVLRFFIRLMKDTKTFDTKKYTVLQEMIDEIGRMLGGWIRSMPR